MSKAIHKMGMGAKRALISDITFRQTQKSTLNQTTYTFSSMDFGAVPAAGEKRYVVVHVHGMEGGTGSYSWSSCTIGGSAGTSILQANDDGATTALFWREVSTGTSGDIVATHSQQITRAGCATYRVIVPVGQELYLINSVTSVLATANDRLFASPHPNVPNRVGTWVMSAFTTGDSGSSGSIILSRSGTTPPTDYGGILENTAYYVGGAQEDTGASWGLNDMGAIWSGSGTDRAAGQSACLGSRYV